ncbi:hypothetical protein Trydic_g17769 [Trypoxylus dichotomus]
MIFRRLVALRCYGLIRNYCQKEKRDDFPPGTLRRGDNGKSCILSGEVFPKDHEIFQALGTTEELLSFLGIAKEHAREANHQYVDKLKRIQTVVIEIQTSLSNYRDDPKKNITAVHITELENWMKAYAKELPPPENYIIPGSGVTSASLHVARTVCRKAERYITPFVRKGILNPSIQMYLNRLSNFLLMLSRIAAKLDKQNEHIYVPLLAEKQEIQKKKD